MVIDQPLKSAQYDFWLAGKEEDLVNPSHTHTHTYFQHQTEERAWVWSPILNEDFLKYFYLNTNLII